MIERCTPGHGIIIFIEFLMKRYAGLLANLSAHEVPNALHDIELPGRESLERRYLANQSQLFMLSELVQVSQLREELCRFIYAVYTEVEPVDIAVAQQKLR